MHTVDLLVVGRGQNVVDTAIAYIEGLGYRILGTTLEEEALDILDREQVRFLVIGGGVETESQKTLTAKADERGTTAVAAKRAGRDVEQYLAEEILPALRG